MKKAMKSMKKKGTMKRHKAMKVSKIAKGKRAKSSVFRGRKAKTSGGLKKQDLIKSKSGKVVSKKNERSGQDIGGIEEAGSHQKQVGKSRIQKNERSGQVSIQKKRIG